MQNIPLGTPAESAGPLYVKTDIPPEQIFQAIGRLREDARKEIDRLIRFLDATDNHMELEPEDEGDDVEDEPSLGSLDRMADQSKAWESRHHHFYGVPADSEEDNADAEPSLGSVGEANQERWAAGDPRDLELDGAESGIGDLDGLHEQIGTNDWTAGRGGMV